MPAQLTDPLEPYPSTYNLGSVSYNWNTSLSKATKLLRSDSSNREEDPIAASRVLSPASAVTITSLTSICESARKTTLVVSPRSSDLIVIVFWPATETSYGPPTASPVAKKIPEPFVWKVFSTPVLLSTTRTVAASLGIALPPKTTPLMLAVVSENDIKLRAKRLRITMVVPLRNKHDIILFLRKIKKKFNLRMFVKSNVALLQVHDSL